jgi:hypothetical protein
MGEGINRDVTDNARSDGFTELVECIAGEMFPGEGIKCVRSIVAPYADDEDFEPHVAYETRRKINGRLRVVYFQGDVTADDVYAEVIFDELERSFT